jgi:His-Xaa-Ser system protein HxsD
MSSNLSIEQIVLINNLLYCEKFGNPKTDFLSSSNECKSVGQYVESVLANIHFVDDKEYRTGMLGYEFKEIFNAVNCDERLKSLVIREIHIEDAEAGGGRSVYLYDPEAKEAIVAALYKYTDRFYIHQQPEGNAVKIVFESKDGGDLSDTIVKQFCNDLIDQQVRYNTNIQFGHIRDLIVEEAFKPVS